MSTETHPAVSDAMREAVALVEATLRKAVIAGSTNGRTTEDIVSELSGPIASEIARLTGEGAKFFADNMRLTARAEASEAETARLRVSVDVQRMDTSRGPDFYVRISCGGRECTPFMFRERFKAEYEAAHFAWIFGLRPDEPEILAYDETTHPNDPHAVAPAVEGTDLERRMNLLSGDE